MPKDYKLYLNDILESAGKIENYSKNISYEDFIKNPLLVDGVIRNLQIIGEAAKKVPAGIKRKYSNVEWKKIAGLRDVLIHEYFRINLKIVWDIVCNKIPELKSAIKQIVKENEKERKLFGMEQSYSSLFH